MIPDFDGSYSLYISPVVRQLNALAPFKGKKIIGLGEATHGSAEFSRAKSRLIIYLVVYLHFNSVAIETSESTAMQLDEYVTGQRADIDSILENCGYWIIATREFRFLMRWLRGYNATHMTDPVHMYGYDLDPNDTRRSETLSIRDGLMAEFVLNLAKERKKIIVWSHNSHISNLHIPEYTTMGSILKEKLHQSYLSIGFYFCGGEFRAIHQQTGEIQVFPIHKASDIPCDEEEMVVDFSKQHNTKYRVFEIGASYNPEESDDNWYTVAPQELFDYTVVIKTTSPVTLLERLEID